MIRRPPRSTRPDTLFPYPTLSRSRLFGDDRPDVAVLGHRHAADIGKHMAHAQNLAAMALEEGGELARVEVIGIVRQRFVFGRRDRLGRKPVLAQSPLRADRVAKTLAIARCEPKIGRAHV